MIFSDINTILVGLASTSIGVFLGALISKIFSSKGKSSLHWYFYGYGILVIVVSIIIGFKNYDDFFNPFSLAKVLVLCLSVISGIIILIFTKTSLIIKNVYTSAELDPIVNSFTDDADKTEIKLFGGDLNFFGNNPSEIDNNSQYTHLRSMAFTKTLILCETPNNPIQKIRYGKILSEIPGAQLKFYNPENADLRVRGRIIKQNGSDRLLMYTKIKSKIYQAIKTDTANSSGALYNNMWELIWGLAEKPSNQDIESYKSLFNGKIHKG